MEGQVVGGMGPDNPSVRCEDATWNAESADHNVAPWGILMSWTHCEPACAIIW